MPSTILSRCAIVRFRPIPIAILSNWLEKQHAVSEQKAQEISEENLFLKRNKVARFAIAKGYEPDFVWELVKELVIA